MAENFKSITIEDAISCYFQLPRGQKSEVLQILMRETDVGLSSWVHRLRDWNVLKNYNNSKVSYREIFIKTIARLHGEVIEEQL